MLRRKIDGATTALAKSKINWFVPRWDFVPRYWREITKVFGGAALLRIVVASAVSGTILVVACKLAFPMLVLPNVWQMIGSAASIPLLFSLHLGTALIIPPHISVGQKKIQKSHGQSGTLIKGKDLLSAAIYVHRDDKIRLKLRYRGRRRLQTLTVGVPLSVDLDTLVSLLPVEPAIRDARERLIGRSVVGKPDYRKPAHSRFGGCDAR